MADFEVEVKGLNELKRALRDSGPAMRREFCQEFKKIGQVLTSEAQSIARQQGLVGKTTYANGKKRKGYTPGNLVKKITPQASEMQVRVRETAVRKSKGYTKGFPYPKVYEYGGATHRPGPMSGGKGSASEVKRRSKTAKSRGLGAGATKVTGSRAFMAPALAKTEAEILRRFLWVLDRMAADFGRST